VEALPALSVPVTIYDIAREANVGIGTVSRVFNNHPSVSEETRRRVLTVAAHFNYHPHPYARGLARKRTNAFLAVIPFFTTFFFLEILHGVQSALADGETDLLLHGVSHPDHAEPSLRRVSSRGRFDGILYFSMRLPDDFVQEVKQLKVPLVLVDAYHPDFDSFSVENVVGARQATAHLHALGHRRIGMLAANLESLPARERLSGYRQGLEEAGIAYDASIVLSSTSPRLDGFTRETGYELMGRFIAMGSRRPSAVFVSSDVQAAGALMAVQDAGLRCPEDFAIIGFDDIALAGHIGLTTMRQPLVEMGRLAVQRLNERLATPDLPITQHSFVPELVVRRSCGSGSPSAPELTTTQLTYSHA
jgi:LacI family transcriptional regulator